LTEFASDRPGLTRVGARPPILPSATAPCQASCQASDSWPAPTNDRAIVGAMAALTGFVVTVTVLVVQMATGTLSARYMRLWYRDRLLKLLLALLVAGRTTSRWP
jgi:hypothetical protein